VDLLANVGAGTFAALAAIGLGEVAQLHHPAAQLGEDLVQARLLRGIVGLAESLRMRTVAEGVETVEEAFYLRAVGVDYGQGYFWSKAIPAAQMSALLERGFAATLEWPGTD